MNQLWAIASYVLVLIAGLSYGLWYAANNTGVLLRPISVYYSNGVDSTRCVTKIILDATFIQTPFYDITSRSGVDIPIAPGIHFPEGVQ